ncbi:MAG TPA: hypothetical protein PLM07_16540 [Candidatus Rifleibacterium sp.]|nr:hypothetical protein [Candidatus Rifleibacterium sp.]HPT47492.1 hypothetical protein [Candidatus Rifleibacterium sp.]
MKYKKILYVTTCYYLKNSSAAIRNNALVRGLSKLGHEVDVLTVEWPEGKKSAFFAQEMNGRVFYSKLKNYNVLQKKKSFFSKFFKGIGLSNFLANLFFFPDVCKEWPSEIMKLDLNFTCYDLLVSSSDLKSSHFAAKEIKVKYPNLKWAQIWGDPWADDIGLSILHKLIVRLIEPKILNCADLIFYTNELTVKKMHEKYPSLSKRMNFCPRSYYREVYHEELQNSDSIRLLYPGAFGSGRDISLLASVLDEFNLGAKKRVELVVFSNADSYKSLEKFKCIEFHPPIDYDEILQQFAMAHGAIFIENYGESGQIPGKLFDYFGTMLPIVCLLKNRNNKLGQFLDRFERCIILPNERDFIARNIDELIKRIKLRTNFELDYSPEAVAEYFISKSLG